MHVMSNKSTLKSAFPADFLYLMPLNYPKNSPLDVPTYAVGQGEMCINPFSPAKEKGIKNEISDK